MRLPFSFTTALAMLLFITAAFGSMHLLALSSDSRLSRAFIAMGF